MAQHDKIQERELALRIVHMHDDLGMGFRRCAKELRSQGYKVNKDSANRLYNMYKQHSNLDVQENRSLEKLRAQEARMRREVPTLTPLHLSIANVALVFPIAFPFRDFIK